MAEFWRRNGAQGGEPCCPRRGARRASRGYAARRVTPPVRKVKPSGSFGVPPPPIKHYSAHHSAGAIIPALTHRIPSELRSYACLGESSTRMGSGGKSSCCTPFCGPLLPFFKFSAVSFLFFFLARSPIPYRSLREIRELPGRLGPTELVWPTERDERPKMGRNAPEMAEFWRRNGAQGGEPCCPRRGARRELRVDMQLAA
ncbi:UNVERIFIED_CONTAM: hypothetical protein Sradi_7206600 [Sesamum radiatum]|uniref:Uncharacterized protein n=1 Tax=Sesamum radiatum TaxID=300843 RepID=A0AAW2IQE5_SESRA